LGVVEGTSRNVFKTRRFANKRKKVLTRWWKVVGVLGTPDPGSDQSPARRPKSEEYLKIEGGRDRCKEVGNLCALGKSFLKGAR